MTSDQTQSSDPRMALDFVDPLFAVVISISLVEVMNRPWFEPASGSSFHAHLIFDITSLALGYSTVVLSWVGYHISIKYSPILLEKRAGFFRFILDVVLLGCYWLLLVKFENFWFVLLMLSTVHWVFVFWDQMKKREYASADSEGSRRRRGVSTFWAIIFTLLFALYWSLGFSGVTVTFADWVFVVLAHAATIIYRLHKSYLRPGSLLDILAFHTPEFPVKEETN